MKRNLLKWALCAALLVALTGLCAGALATDVTNNAVWGLTEACDVGEGTFAQAVAYANAISITQTSYIKLTGDVTAAEFTTGKPFTINRNVTLNLNGCTINRGLTEATANGGVLKIERKSGGSTTFYPQLTITDSRPNGKIGGITGGNTTDYGGGIYVGTGAKLVIQGGKIYGNTAKDYGGGVFLSANGNSFEMSAGEISGNNASQGGGVYSSKTIAVSGTAVITGNSASTQNGGGVFGGGANAIPIMVSGSPRITGNIGIGGATNDVFLATNSTNSTGYQLIHVNGALTDGAKIGVRAVNPPATGAALAITKDIYTDVPDASDYSQWVINAGGGELADPTRSITTYAMPAKNARITATYEKIPFSVTVHNGVGDGDYTVGDAVRISADTAANGMRFSRWVVNSANVALTAEQARASNASERDMRSGSERSGRAGADTDPDNRFPRDPKG